MTILEEIKQANSLIVYMFMHVIISFVSGHHKYTSSTILLKKKHFVSFN